MPYILKKYYPWRNLFFAFGEGILIFLIIESVIIYRVGFAEFHAIFLLYTLRALVITFVFQICFYYFDLYDLTIMPPFADHILSVVQTFGFGFIVLAFIYYLFPFLNLSTRLFWRGFFAVGLAVFFWRFFYFKILERRMFVQPVAVVGNGDYAREIVAAVERKNDSGFKIVALVGGRESNVSSGQIPVFHDIKRLRELCESRAIVKIVVALDEKRGIPLYELIQYKFLGIEIMDGARFLEALAGKIPVKRINPSYLVFSDGFHVSRIKKMLKRIFDIAIASTALLILSPIFLISALSIRLESSGGIFYLQERVGENRKVFNIVKFRSMYEDAEINGPVWAREDDCRVTRFGRFIRKTRIDELPQLINVLRGHMSLVGPRPERPVFVENLEKKIPFYSNRHLIKPGITGWAQIYYPYGASEEDALCKLEYDLYYIKNLSITIDILILFQTIKVVLFRKGAR